jgi:hypothetical protein
MKYSEFIASKNQAGADSGFDPLWLHPVMFDFQSAMAEYAIKKGRAALLEDCGMGKTLQFLVWAQNVVMKTNKNVLVVSPLAVTLQILREAEKFGIEVKRSIDGKTPCKITVTNYERLHFFDWKDFGGVVCDESSRIKSDDAATRVQVTGFLRKIPYRLLTTATAAPNDYIELGTSSEALGYLGFMDMLNKFFKNDQNNSAMRRMYGEAPKWRFRGHAEEPFWRWVCSWARALRKPSDLGFDDGKFVLPPLTENEHIVEAKSLAPGMLFNLPARDLREQREERKRTIKERCEKIASLVDTDKPALVWCHLNEEGDLLQKLIPGSVQVSGKDKDEAKEEKLMGFADRQFRVLVTKPKIGAWGMNFQHCAHVVEFPSHSYEQKYQGIRRCWRFGQEREVVVDTVLTEGERKVLDNVKRKALSADVMFTRLVENMNKSMGITVIDRSVNEMEVPEWV